MPLIERALQAKIRFIANPANVFATPPKPVLTGRELAEAQKAAFRAFGVRSPDAKPRSARPKPRKTR